MISSQLRLSTDAPVPTEPLPSAPDTLSRVDVLDFDIDTLDDDDPVLPTTDRFTTVAYTDASFAVRPTKDSYSGYVIFVNGTPIMWGAARQKVIADSTCAAEFVAASICCKQLMHLETCSVSLVFCA